MSTRSGLGRWASSVREFVGRAVPSVDRQVSDEDRQQAGQHDDDEQLAPGGERQDRDAAQGELLSNSWCGASLVLGFSHTATL